MKLRLLAQRFGAYSGSAAFRAAHEGVSLGAVFPAAGQEVAGAFDRAQRSVQKALDDRYPSVLRYGDVGSVMVYRVDERSPDEIASTGGFLPTVRDQVELRSAVDGWSASHRGMVGTSVCPHMVLNFAPSSKPSFLYAFPLPDEALVYPLNEFGTEKLDMWRQLALPGCRLTQGWRVRPIEKMDHHDVELGPVMGDGCVPDAVVFDDNLHKVLQDDHLVCPKDVALGDEHSAPFYIVPGEKGTMPVHRVLEAALFGSVKGGAAGRNDFRDDARAFG